MATHAGEQRRQSLAGWLALLAPAPGRLEFAFRLALMCTLTTLVVAIFRTPEAALTAYVSFFVIKPDRATSVIMSIAMLFLVSVVIGMVLLLAMAVIDHPLLRVTAMAILSFCLLFTASASKLRPVGGILALIVAYALDLLGSAPIGELATRALLYAWLFVGIPAAVSVAVNLLIGPAPRQLAQRALAHRLALAASVLRTPDDFARRALGEALSEGAGEIDGWLKLAALEKTSAAEDIAALRRAGSSVTQILLLVDLVDSDGISRWPPLLRDRVASTLDEMAAILQAGGYPVDIGLDDEALGPALPPEGTAIFLEMREALVRFTEQAVQPMPMPEKKKAGFFLPDAFTNPEHVQYALKTTAAAMFCYVVYSLLDWPGIHTSLITCYIVSLGTAAETVEKLTLRIAGCLVGAAVGVAALVFLMPGVTSIGGLMAVVFLAALGSGWVAAGSPRISYAGFQIAFAFFLCVIQGASPAFDVTVARDRIIGILFGNLVMYVVSTTIWPVSVTRRIDPAIAVALRRLSAMMAATGRSIRYELAGEARAALGTLEQDMGLAHYEPPAVRPTAEWLEARGRAAQEIAALQGPLLLSARLDPARSTDLAGRLGKLADGVGDHSNLSGARETAAAGPGPQEAPDASTQGMHGRIDDHLGRLAQALVHRPQEESRRRPRHAPA